jgi:hypothetical protein
VRPGTTFAFELESCIGILDVSLTVPASDDLSKMVNKWKFISNTQKLTITLNNALTKNGVLTVRYIHNGQTKIYKAHQLEALGSVTDKKSDERFMSNGIIFLDNNQLGTSRRNSLRVVLVIDCCLRLLN